VRLAGLKSITPLPDFGGDLTVPNFEAEINGYHSDEEAYNLALSNLDEMKNNLDTRGRKVKDMDSRWLSAIRAKSGPDSDDYEKAGGTRRSDRKKPGPKGSKSSPKT